MKTWLMVLVPLFALGMLINWRLHEKRLQMAEEMGGGGARKRGAASVELALPQVRDITKSYTATGSVESIQDVKISPRISGRIEYLEVREGDRVTPGQVLVRLDQSEVQAQVRQQQANLAEARSRLAQAQLNQTPVDAAVSTQIRQQEANLTNTQADLHQAQQTHTAQLEATKAAVDDAQSKVENASATIASAEAELRQAQATYTAQLEASKATLDDAQSKIDTATASIANATAQVKSAQANLENATSKYDRMFSLYQQGYVAAQDVDDAKTTVRVQQSNVDTAKGQLQSAQAALASAQAQKRNAEQQTAITRAKAEAEVESARAKVAQTKAALESAKAQKRNAEQQANITRVKAAGDVETAQTKITQAKATLDYARANTKSSPAYAENLLALRAGIAAAQASLDAAQARLNDTILRSPLSGVVSARTQEVGGMASPGQALLTVQSLNHVWVAITVPADICRRLYLNQSARVAFDALDGQAYTGRIAQINPSADPESRQYTARVILENSAHRFTPGMFAKVTLVVEKASQAQAVPSAVVQQDRDGSHYLFVVSQDNIARQRLVQVGVSDGNWTAILDGLRPNERMVTMSGMPLHDGQQVRAAGGRRGGKPGGAPAGGGATRPGQGERDGQGSATGAPARRTPRGVRGGE